MSAYLSQWVDLGLDVPADEDAKAIQLAEVERLAKLLAIATAAAQIPRRLGGEVDDLELASDKRRSKRVAHVAAQLLDAWASKVKSTHVQLADISKEAAIVNWERWWQDHRIWLLNRQRYIATWCHKTGADEKWCKSALVKLDNELKWLDYCFRD